jgi:hypothetical protein
MSDYGSRPKMQPQQNKQKPKLAVLKPGNLNMETPNYVADHAYTA